MLSLLIGEGGSGGALALAVADEVWMMENAIYSVISPEGCASILWKDPAQTQQAAACLRLTAQDLFSLGVIERVIGEDQPWDMIFAGLRDAMDRVVTENIQRPLEELLAGRYQKFRKIGEQQ